MTHEPLWDLAGRTLCLGHDVSNTIEGLLRLQNATNYQRPITLYIYGSPSMPAPSPTDAMLVCALIRVLRSPVQTVGMGLIQSAQSLVLAAGTHRRYLIRHALVSLSPMKWETVPSARAAISFGQQTPSRSPRTQLEEQFEQLVSELKLDPELFQSDQLLPAEAAVQHQLADVVVTQPLPQITPTQEPSHETNR
jgi:ATP-dependent protease ClpP protease subunit